MVRSFCPVVLFCLLVSCGGGAPSPSSDSDATTRGSQDVPQVTVMTVQRGVFLRELQSNGRLVALSKADLYFRTAGLITSVEVQNGQRVSAGQVIARIEDFELRNKLTTSTETVENALVYLNDFLMTQGFRKGLEDTVSAPPVLLQTGYAKAQLLSARVAQAQARFNLQNAVLHSPISGTVANLTAKQHNMTPTTEPFCTVIGDRFEVEFPVLESEIELLKAGHEVQIEPLAYPGTLIKGILNGMNPVVDKNGMVKAKAIVANIQGKLYEGMNVRVLVQQAVPDKLVVPKSAVVMRSDRQVLFVYVNGRSLWHYVETGLENSREYTIETELEAGEQVIIGGNFNLAHDVEVMVTND